MAGELAHATVGDTVSQAEFEDTALHTMTWADWTPTVNQTTGSTGVDLTVTQAKYCQVGKKVTAKGLLAITGTGTTGQSIQIGGWPVSIGDAATSCIGTAYVYDSSVGFYATAIRVISSTSVGLIGYNVVDYMGVTPNFGLAAGDAIAFTAEYIAT